jgi:hypothetical protein
MVSKSSTQAIATESNWRRLLAAILTQAVIDAQSADPALAAPARRWLASTGIEMVQWLDISPGRVATWVSDLPALAWEQLALPM